MGAYPPVPVSQPMVCCVSVLQMGTQHPGLGAGDSRGACVCPGLPASWEALTSEGRPLEWGALHGMLGTMALPRFQGARGLGAAGMEDRSVGMIRFKQESVASFF